MKIKKLKSSKTLRFQNPDETSLGAEMVRIISRKIQASRGVFSPLKNKTAASGPNQSAADRRLSAPTVNVRDHGAWRLNQR